MAGPPAKAPRPDRSAFLSDKCHEKDIWHLSISCSFKWEYVCDRKKEIKNKQNKKTHGVFSYKQLQEAILQYLLFFSSYLILGLCWSNFASPPEICAIITFWLIYHREREAERERIKASAQIAWIKCFSYFSFYIQCTPRKKSAWCQYSWFVQYNCKEDKQFSRFSVIMAA